MRQAPLPKTRRNIAYSFTKKNKINEISRAESLALGVRSFPLPMFKKLKVKINWSITFLILHLDI